MTLTIGVDPGVTGAIALVDNHGALVDAYDMPVVGGQVSAQLLATIECWSHGDPDGS